MRLKITFLLQQKHIRGEEGVNFGLVKTSHFSTALCSFEGARVTAQAFVVLKSDPQLLVGFVKTIVVSYIFVVGHAPIRIKNMTTDEYRRAVRTYWEEVTRSIIPHRHRSDHLVCLFDANAHLSQACYPYIGASGLVAHTNENG